MAEDLRRKLEAEREQLGAELADLVGTDEAAHDAGLSDRSSVAAERGGSELLVNDLRGLLDEVEAALVRLDEGRYGSCETCGEPVGAERLEALPTTRFCRSCASA